MKFLIMPFGLVLTVIGMITLSLSYSLGWAPLLVGVAIILSRRLSVPNKKVVRRRRHSRTSLHTDSSYYDEPVCHDYGSDSDGGGDGGSGGD